MEGRGVTVGTVDFSGVVAGFPLPGIFVEGHHF